MTENNNTGNTVLAAINQYHIRQQLLYLYWYFVHIILAQGEVLGIAPFCVMTVIST